MINIEECLFFDSETDDYGGYKRKKLFALNPLNKIIMQQWAIGNEAPGYDYNKLGLRKEFPSFLLGGLMSEGIKYIVGHNIKYDMLYYKNDKLLQEWFAEGGRLVDTTLLEYLLSGQKFNLKQKNPYYSLSMDKCCVRRKLPYEKDDRVKVMFNSGMKASEIPEDILVPYGLNDINEGRALFIDQMHEVRNKMHFNLLLDYMDSLAAVLEMELNGLPMDVPRMSETRDILHEKLIKIHAKFRELLKPLWPLDELDFNPASGDHVSCLLYGGTIVKKGIKVIDYDENGLEKRFGPTAQKAGEIKYKNISKEFNIKGLGYDTSSVKEGKKAGFWCTSKDQLGLLPSTDVLDTLLKFRKYSKLCGTYFDGLVEALFKKSDGNTYVHQNFNMCLTQTGRLSCSQPNVQNQPKEIKQCVISRFGKDGVILTFDYSQLEVVLLAFLSQESLLMAELWHGADVHLLNAALWKGFTEKECAEWKEDQKILETNKDYKERHPHIAGIRKKAKVMTFQLTYGAGAHKMAAVLRIPVDEAEEFINKFYSKYPQIKVFHDILINSVNRNAYRPKEGDNRMLESYLRMFNQKQYYFRQTKWKEKVKFKPTQIKNYPMQGMAADLMHKVTGIVHRWLKYESGVADKAYLINQVHDEVVIDAHKDVVHLIQDPVKNIMESVDSLFQRDYNTKINVPIRVSVSQASNWGDCK